MKMKNQKGFTLIELLVVIAIIGLLSTIAVVAMNSARAKARDAKRLSDIKQASTILDVETAANPGTSNTGVALATCVGDNARLSTCNNANTDIVEFSKFVDPSSTTACAPSAWTIACGGTCAVCDYAISTAAGAAAAYTGDYQICFVLESAAQGYAAGAHQIEKGGVVTDGCS